MYNYDGAIILECTNTFDNERAGIIRPLAPFALHNVFETRSIPSTVFNYVNAWNPDTLADLIIQWTEKFNVKNPLVLCSTLFGNSLLRKGSVPYSVISNLKNKFQHCKLIIGGPINLIDYKFDQILPDVVFQGRSLHLFEHWLDNFPIDDNCSKVVNGIQTYHDPSSKVVEDPIVPVLYDDYCLTSDDILQFEVRLGCKFNCTFCTFEFRNAKKVIDTTSERLEMFFNSAYQYGITRFGCVDDTFNEDDSKIAVLKEAVSKLSFKPKIIGYNRFDIMAAKPWQVKALDECGFVGHYFGIETLHREASKIIRKGIVRENALAFMQYLKDTVPHWHTCSGYIVGIPKEPAEHIIETHSIIAKNKLLDAIIPVDLGLYQIPGNDHNYSDFTRYPEKFGITVLGGDPANLDWEHKMMTKKYAKMLASKLASKNIKSGVTTIDPWEALSRDALGTEDIFTVEKKYKDRFSSDPSALYSRERFEKREDFVNNYIKRKTEFIRSEK
jgi:hypothetical protein